MSFSLKSTALAAVAAVTLGTALVPSQAEARWGYRGGAVAAGIIGGIAAGALIAGATRPAYGYYAPAYYAPAYYGPACFRVRERVWSDYRGRFVTVRRTVCN